MKADFLFISLHLKIITQKKNRQKKTHFIDDALKTRGITYLNVETGLLFAPSVSKFLATRLLAIFMAIASGSKHKISNGNVPYLLRKIFITVPS